MTKKPDQPLTFSSLPDEIVENCLARISKWNYTSLSLVSKRFLSLISSPELYTTRSHIKTTEPCLYFCVKSRKQESPKWFTLWMKPGDDDDEIQEDYSLVHVPSSSSPSHPNHHHHVPDRSTVAVGPEIYLIGGRYKSPPSSAVRILDCRNHTWRDGPSLNVAREDAFAVYLDEKIYVMGGCGPGESYMEVFDLKTKTWRPLPSNGAAEELRSEDWLTDINVVKGKIYAIADETDYAYDPKEGTWEVVETHSSAAYIDVWCVIDNVMYCYTNSGYCMWYDSKSREWKEVKGTDFEVLRTGKTFSIAWGCALELLNYGGKLLVLWVPRFEEHNAKPERRIKCAKFALEKRDDGEIWGMMDWFNTVLTVSKSYEFLSCAVISI